MLRYRHDGQTIMKNKDEIPDIKEFEYLITYLNLYTISNSKVWLLNKCLSDHIDKIKRLSEEYNLNVPNWVKEFYPVIGQGF